MQIFDKRDALQDALNQVRSSNQRIGLVPTMGNLHEGHLALVDAAKKQSDFVLATIFVNPLQFGPDEDLDNYPRTLEADYEKLASRGCNGVFVPAVSEMYPTGLDNQTLISVPGLSEKHCGKSRPSHFDGVCTVVNKLLNLTMPDLAFFGEKDFQQLQIIRKMAADFCMPINITGVPIVRQESGLAMSSRNNYLDDKQLLIAPGLYQCLKNISSQIQEGNRDFSALEITATIMLEDAGLKPDYFHICQIDTLEAAKATDNDLVILAAAWLGPTRLIDNFKIALNAK